ncbi:MAG: hypothetical protein AAGH88_03795 [Planctomycetota bacterium]
MANDPSEFRLQDPIQLDDWEQYWIERTLRPFELKALSRKRCKLETIEKAQHARKSAQQILKELSVDASTSAIYPFSVDTEEQGMAWGGYAIVQNGRIMSWYKTWLA